MNRVFSVAGILAFVLTLSTVAVRGEINFTPSIDRYMSEGAEYASASFKDGTKNVTMAVPRTWTCRGDASRLQFIPPNETSADGLVQSIPGKGVLRFDEPTVKALAQQVLAGVPSGGQNVTLVTQQENPVLLNGNLSYEFVVSYQTLGKTFLRSVIVVACPDQQLVFRFTAPKSVFDNLNRSFRQSINTWQWTEPEFSQTAVAQNKVQR